MALQSINPATGNLIRQYPVFSARETTDAIFAANTAFLQWRNIPFNNRADCLLRIAHALKTEKNTLAELATAEMGKSIQSACAEIEKCAWGCEYFAERAATFLQDEIIESEASRSYIHFQPLGVILAVMPWNFPFWQLFRFAAPALMAGNSCVLKHASNVSGCALAIERIFRQAGCPENLLRTLLIDSGQVEAVIRHDKVRAVTLTGSPAAGRAVAGAAGKALKKSVMELGGSDPYIILEDADVDAAAASCVKSRLLNNGQSCIAAKRFIVVDAIREAFEQAVVRYMQQTKMGDPMQEDTELGPLARADLREQLHAQVQDSVAQGAHCLLGGVMPQGPGFYYPATVLTGVKAGAPAYTEELFGPVAAIIPAVDTEDAIRIANTSVYGLGAAIFTSDIRKGERIAAERLDAGFCAVNDFVRSDPRLPFGGIKESGYGRELSSYGIREFVNIKTVYVK